MRIKVDYILIWYSYITSTNCLVHPNPTVASKDPVPMNKHVDPKHPCASHSAIGEPSFADVLHAIATDERLSDDRKRHWTTSLRKMADYLDRPLSMIPARISGISRQVMALHPVRLGVNGKTFANHRANTRAALNWFKDSMNGWGREAAMSTAYRDLLALIGCRHHRDLISPFFRFLKHEWSSSRPTSVTSNYLLM